MLITIRLILAALAVLTLVAGRGQATTTKPLKRTGLTAPNPSIQRRQVTSRQIRERRNARRVKSLVKRNEGCAAATPVYPSGVADSSSSRNYPSCAGEAGSGYARYEHWDLYRVDLPGNPYYPEDKQEESCIKRCEEYEGDTCVGVVWSATSLQATCYLKGANVCDGFFTNTSPGSQAEDAAVSLSGDCAAWRPFVPAEMDAVCCNS